MAALAAQQAASDKSVKLPGIPRITKAQNIAFLNQAVFGCENEHLFLRRIVGFIPRFEEGEEESEEEQDEEGYDSILFPEHLFRFKWEKVVVVTACGGPTFMSAVNPADNPADKSADKSANQSKGVCCVLLLINHLLHNPAQNVCKTHSPPNNFALCVHARNGP